MKTTSNALQTFRRNMGLGLAIMVCAQVLPVGAQDRSEKLRRYEADRQACLTGKTNQNFDSCMKEAKAFLNERPGSNPTVSAERLQRNAALRCEALTGEDRAACAARMRGEGSVSGSVAEGGVLRSITTTEVLTASLQRPASSAAGK